MPGTGGGGVSGHYAVLVDAGFFRAEGAKALRLARGSVKFDGAACVKWFSEFSRDPRFADVKRIFANGVFLRAYWYDGAYDPADRRYPNQRAQFDALAIVPGLYLRLGHLQEKRLRWQHEVRKAVQACGISLAEFGKHYEFRSEVEQKGVDTLMALDLVHLARKRVVDSVLLVSGDRDLEEAADSPRASDARWLWAIRQRAESHSCFDNWRTPFSPSTPSTSERCWSRSARPSWSSDERERRDQADAHPRHADQH
jgi:uncharacterized LabA/DUF88 family protein